MKVIIAGSRSIVGYGIVCEAIKASGFDITEAVSGCAPGVDKSGERWAREVLGRRSRIFPALWQDKASPTYNARRGYDPLAGHKRNRQMAEYADALIAVWDGYSAGTRHMIEVARELGLQVYVHQPNRGTTGKRTTNGGTDAI